MRIIDWPVTAIGQSRKPTIHKEPDFLRNNAVLNTCPGMNAAIAVITPLSATSEVGVGRKAEPINRVA
jgi:hypothetical protein